MNALKAVRDQSIVFVCGKRFFFPFGKKTPLAAVPMLVNDVLLIPLESLAAELFYDYSTEMGLVSLSLGSRVVKLRSGETAARIGNDILPLSGAVMRIGEAFYAPAADAAAIFNRRVFFPPCGRTAVFSRLDLRGAFDDPEAAGYLDKLGYEEEAAKGIGFFVSPGNGGGGSGMPESPFGTLERAKQAVRECLDFAEGDVTVWLGGGEYRLDETFVISENESGRGFGNVVFKAYGDGRPVITGFEEITGWEHWRNGIYRANIGEWNFETLAENGVRGVLARFPGAGYARLTGYPGSGVKDSFKYDIELPELERPRELRVFVWPGGSDGYWNWFTDDIFVSDIDYKNKTVCLIEDARYDLGTGSRFYFQGALELLDSPGEYYMDRQEGILYYKPRSLPVEDQKIMVSKVGNLFEIKPSGDAPLARNIRIEGVEFTGAGENAVHIESASNITLKDCVIHSAGLNGIYMNGKSQNNEVRGCSIHDTGENGVFIFGSVGTEDTNRGHRITSNHIYNGGVTVGSGAGIMVEHSGDNIVANNQISDMPRYGVTLKSVPPSALCGMVKENTLVTPDNARLFTHNTRNIIMRNNLYDLSNDSQDSGAIESWGAGAIDKDTSNLISENWIHDIDIKFSYGHGLYLDDQSDGFEVYGNIISKVNHGGAGTVNGIIMAKGINNDIVNNIAADAWNCNAALLTQEADGDGNHDVGSRCNIFYEYGDYFYCNFDDCREDKYKYSDFNLFYRSAGGYATSGFPGDGSLDSWRKYRGGRYDGYSQTADPLFVSPLDGDYRLRYYSPAYALGVRDIPYGDIGLKQDFRFRFADALEKIFFTSGGNLVRGSHIEMAIGQSCKVSVFGRTKIGGFYIGPEEALVEYAVSDSSVAKINPEGAVASVGKGSCRLIASMTYNGNTVTSGLVILVDDPMIGLDVMVDYTRSLTPGLLTVGGGARLIPVIKTEHRRFASDYDDNTRLAFTSKNGHAAIDALGNTYGLSVGRAVIEISAGRGGVEKTKSISIAVGSSAKERRG